MKFFAIFFLFAWWHAPVMADSLTPQPPIFQPKVANQQLDQISIQLSIQNLDINNLTTAVTKLTPLMNDAEDCIEHTKDKLENIDAMIKQGHDVKNTNTNISTNIKTVDLVYLSNEQKKAQDLQAQCRLFLIRAKEAVNAYKKAIVTLKQEKTLEKGIPLWELLEQIAKTPADTVWLDLSTLTIPPMLDSFMAWSILILSTLLLSTFIIFRVFKSRFAHRYLKSSKVHFSYIPLVSGCLVAIILFAYFRIYSENINNPILSPMRPVLAYFIMILLILFVFKLKKIKSLFAWYKLDISFFKSLALWFSSLYQLKVVGHIIAQTLKINPLLIQFNQAAYCFTLIVVAMYFTHRFTKTHLSLRMVKAHQRFLRRTGNIILLCCLALEILGYHTLAIQILNGSFIAAVTLFTMWLSLKGINDFYHTFYTNARIKKFIIKQFGFQEDQSFTEFLILKCIIQIIILVACVIYIGNYWQFVTDSTWDPTALIINGFHIANLTIYPARLTTGMVVFCILYLSFRFVAKKISKTQQFQTTEDDDGEEEIQVAVASILNYIGFAFSVCIGLLVAGFDFTALAIVAGALSVGIGLGLQSIVNNFVSGLILLIEKPIKPGDRIRLDDIEGCVKKISVRSTLILTPLREDIIVPNSELITKKVTNYTYHDRSLSIHCDVSVAADTDVHLVESLLLEIANEHEDVIKNTRNKPYVLFASMNDDKLVFQLWCLIKDAHNKALIHSELNFAIHQRFKENNIHA